MEEHQFSKFEIAALKRTAANVDKYVSRKNKLVEKKTAIDAELTQLQTMIDGWQEPIKSMTGGYTTEDLVVKTIDKSGANPVTKYSLKYPDTVIPVTAGEQTDAQVDPDVRPEVSQSASIDPEQVTFG